MKNAALGIFCAGEPLNLVEPVDAPIAELSVGVVEEVAEPAGVHLVVERAQRRGAAPHVPVHFFGNFGIVGGILFSAAAIDEAALDHAQLADVPVEKEFPARAT